MVVLPRSGPKRQPKECKMMKRGQDALVSSLFLIGKSTEVMGSGRDVQGR